jgi:hypothetical protein
MMVRIHHMAVDSKGNIFVAALGQGIQKLGQGIQKLVPHAR